MKKIKMYKMDKIENWTKLNKIEKMYKIEKSTLDKKKSGKSKDTFHTWTFWSPDVVPQYVVSKLV